MIARVLLVLVLPACDVVFGLDERLSGNDEDLDGRDNSTDNCPSLANRDQEDADDDDVGDVCDPHPMTAGDRIAGRFFFDDPLTDGDDWSGSGFLFESGYAAQPIGEGSGRLSMRSTIEAQILVVEIGAVITDASLAWYTNGTGIEIDGSGGHRCFVEVQESSSSRETRLAVTAAQDQSDEFLDAPLLDGSPFRLVGSIDRSTNKIDCTLGGTSVTVSGPSLVGPLGIYTDLNAMELHYVIAYVVP
ncbi:MAG: hypothetical protein ACKV2T_08030 [Kofleriaceae bacterium]